MRFTRSLSLFDEVCIAFYVESFNLQIPLIGIWLETSWTERNIPVGVYIEAPLEALGALQTPLEAIGALEALKAISDSFDFLLDAIGLRSLYNHLREGLPAQLPRCPIPGLFQ